MPYGAVPSTFGLEACVDSKSIWLRNQLSVPVRIKVTGASGRVAAISSDGSIAALVTRSRYPDPAVMLPGDLVRGPLGSGAASVYLADTDAGGYYAEALTLSAFLPLGAPASVYDTIADGIADLVNDNVNYKNCLVGANSVQQMACDLVRQSAVTHRVGKMIVLGLAKCAVKIVLDFANWADKISQQVRSVSTIVHSERTLNQAAVNTPATTPTGGAGSGGGPVNPPQALSVSVTGSCTTDGGTLTGSSSGFTPGKKYTVSATRPDGSDYPLGAGSSGTVRSNGTIVWNWPCQGDPAGTYSTRVTDTATGRTASATFTIGAGAPPPSQTKRFHIEDDYYGGTWARTDPDNGTWYRQSTRPPNGAYWYPNWLGVAVDCARSAAGYVVRYADGHTQTWTWWLHVTDGKWYPAAATQEIFVDGNRGVTTC